MGDIPTLELLKSEYNKGKSIQDIASNLGHSVHKIAYWMKNIFPEGVTVKRHIFNKTPTEIRLKLRKLIQTTMLFYLDLELGFIRAKEINLIDTL